FVPVFLGLGALTYFGLAGEPGWFPLLSALAVAGLLFLVGRDRQAMRLAALAAVLAVGGMVLSKIETVRASTKMLGAEITTNVTGRVEAVDHLASGRVRLTLSVLATERPRLRYAPDRVRATARKLPEGLRVGRTVSGL